MGVPAVAVSATGRLDVAVVDTLNAFAWYQSFVSGQGSGWQNISANVSASIFQTDDGDNVSYGLSMASVVPGRLDMFGSSGAGSLFHARFVNGQWSPTNSSQGVPGASQTPGIAQSPDLTELFNLYIAPPIPGSVNPTVLERSEDANGGTTGWLDLGGPNITNVPAGISGPAVVAWNDPVSATPSPGTPPTPVVTPTPTPFPTTPTPTATPVPTLQGTYQGTMTQDTTRQQHTFTMQVTQSGSNLRGTLTIAGAPSPLRFSGSINSQGQVSITGANVQPVELATFSGVLDNTGRVSGRYSATFAGSSSSGGFSMTPV